jgi:hypothetical protein
VSTIKVWDVSECVYEGSSREDALSAWYEIPESRRGDRALCQVDVDGRDDTTRFLAGEVAS